MRWSGLLVRSACAVAVSLAPQFSTAREPLPEDVKRPYFELCQSNHGGTAEYLLAIPYRVADINGDGSPEYVFEVKHKTYDNDAHPPSCRQIVFSKTDGGYADVARFSCCTYQIDTKRHRVTCADPGSHSAVLAYSGAWPHEGKSATPREAKAAYDQAAGLFKAARYADAEAAVCATAKRQCIADAAYLDMCAKAELMTKRLEEAEQDLDDATSIAPDYAPSYATQGMLWQMRGAVDLAIKAYEMYLSKAPNAGDRGRIEAQVAKLRQQGSPKQ